ncbi:MAG: hypothetical protein JXA08_09600 [Methanomicrobiaceae archaeon]|nr:hypothetical protein [Methanomicrobiaceae archaeon]
MGDVEKMIDWEQFRPIIKDLSTNNTEKGGRPNLDVIELRRCLYPERHDYEMIGSSMTDLHWLDDIPGDRPVLVIAEGMVEYLPKEGAVALFTRITTQFPGGEIIFDAYSRLTVRIRNLAIRVSTLLSKPAETGGPVHLPWGIDDPRKLERLVPGLRLVTAIPFLTMPELVGRLAYSRVQALPYRVLERCG